MNNETTCASFLKQLRVDHRHFDMQVLRIRNALGQAAGLATGAGDGPDRKPLLDCLHGLRAQLQKHFSQEENEGCLWEAASFNTALCADVKKLLGDHPVLLARLDTLIAQAEQAGSRDNLTAELLAEFDQLARLLAEHESREAMILEKSLTDAS
jgi:hypothetical protein